MSVRKFAISVPEEVMDQVDRTAAQWGVTRSRFISEVLRRVARVRSDAEITRRLDEIFGDCEVAQEQKVMNRSLLDARRDAGTEW